MNFFESAFLGAVQGLTEFIPVSSSGHLELLPKLFNWNEPSTAFITFLHFGTLLALLIFYRKTIWSYLLSIKNLLSKKADKDDKSNLIIVRNVIIATIPAGILGFILSNIIESIYDAPENTKLASLLTALAMIGVGIVFIFANKVFTSKKFQIEKLGSGKALFIGLAQAIAIFRGTSRSGITLLAGQAAGLDRVSAAEFGFLMSIPITFVAAAFGTLDLIKEGGLNMFSDLPIWLAGFLTSFTFGYIAIKFMINFLKKRGLQDFGYYRIFFGILVLLVLL